MSIGGDMVQKNGYFQIEFNERGAICHVYPNAEGGKPLAYKEIAAFLETHGFSYDKMELHNACTSPDETEVPVIPHNMMEFAESIDVLLDHERTMAVCRFYPGSKKGGRLNENDIMAALKQKEVVYGINQRAVRDYIEGPVYCTNIKFAQGTPVVPGKDAKIDYFFDVNHSTKPAYLEDGSVDFHTLNMISHVFKGDLLAELTPEVPGKPGRTVDGKEIKPGNVKPAFLSVGQNITLSDDRTKAYSDVTGHASLVNDQIFVSDIYEIPADVDNSTGDIDYNGNVYIRGSVREGFKVNANGDVIIDGTIEGAEVYAGGQIVIKRGVNGMGKGRLEARGNIVAKFIENAIVVSGGYVESGSIMHSKVNARGDVVVEEKKGFITDSRIRCGSRVIANIVGSEHDAATVIEIGMDPQKKERYLELEHLINQVTRENEQMSPVVANYKQQIKEGIELDAKNGEYYLKLKKKVRDNKIILEKSMEEYRDLQEQMQNSRYARIDVRRDLYPGTKIVCGELSMTMKTKRSHCYLEKKNGEIVIENL